jgi:dCTP deaminase
MHFQAGIQPDTVIEQCFASGILNTLSPLSEGQIQPASLDLRLGAKAYRVRASFLTGREHTVCDRLTDRALHVIDLTQGAVLETGCVYIAEIQESVSLPANVSAATNPKSSTGRIDVFTRVITDRGVEFDTIEAGYDGPLYLEISPRTFPVLVRMGSRLSQLRLRSGRVRLSDAEVLELHQRTTLVSGDEPRLEGGVGLSVDLSGFSGFDSQGVHSQKLIGYRAKNFTGLIDVDKPASCRVQDYWEPIFADESRSLILDPGHFYILASREAVHVPPETAAEMMPFDALVGEFRVHYAGFFDPGFGHSAIGGAGARAVLEVRSRDVPFFLEHGQSVGRLVYERMSAPASQLYGQIAGSNYQAQGLKLSKHFKEITQY